MCKVSCTFREYTLFAYVFTLIIPGLMFIKQSNAIKSHVIWSLLTTGRNPAGYISGSLRTLKIKHKQSRILLNQSSKPEESASFLINSRVIRSTGSTI